MKGNEKTYSTSRSGTMFSTISTCLRGWNGIVWYCVQQWLVSDHFEIF